jgi:phosphoribosylamine--glycine ligase
LEYNVRLGDPETQAVLPLMESDLGDLCWAILDGTLGDFPLAWKSGAVCAPVAVADGYPGPYRKGDPITVDRSRLDQTGARIFIAGAQTVGDTLVTSGGRVLAVSAWGKEPEAAWTRAYAGMEAVSFAGKSFRTDIGKE